MDETVEQAVAAARARHPDGEWERLSPSERTEAIYREMRRIDAEAVDADAGPPTSWQNGVPGANSGTKDRPAR